MARQHTRLTKKQRRQMRQNGESPTNILSSSRFSLKEIAPKTDNQEKVFDYFDDGKQLLLHGTAGTGKTFLSLYLALDVVLNPAGPEDPNKIYIVRSVVPTRDMGYLPGNAREKTKVYEAPYASICNELFGRGDAYDILKTKNMVEFMSTSFIRGTTFNNAFIIVDECNNCSGHELDSLITRIGNNCRIIFSGDMKQSDLTKEQERAGLKDFIRVINNMPDFAHVEFTPEDIVRSRLVKQYITAREKLGIHL